MAFVKKTWKDRIVQYANRRLLTKSGGEVEQVTVTRDEGTISEAGDRFNASNMNDLETRIDNAISALESGKQNIIAMGGVVSLDANTLYGDGIVKTYRSVSGTITNIPGVDGTLMVISNGGGYSTVQVFVNFNGEIWTRANWGAGSVSWQDWKPITVYKTSTTNDLQFYRYGNTVYFTITSGTFTTNASGIIVINGNTSLIPQGYRPPANCQMWETNLGTRMAAQADGSLWCARTSQSGLALRVSGCWVTTNNMPT